MFLYMQSYSYKLSLVFFPYIHEAFITQLMYMYWPVLYYIVELFSFSYIPVKYVIQIIWLILHTCKSGGRFQRQGNAKW